MQCEHCLSEYKPCRINYNRQKFCTDKKCRRERNIIRSADFRRKNPDHFKNNSLRTSIYSRQKNERRRLGSAAKAAVSDVKRVFVSHLRTFAKLLERQLLTLQGMLSFSAGGLSQTSAFEAGKHLQRCYENGVILKESDPLLTAYLEQIYEEVTRINMS